MSLEVGDSAPNVKLESDTDGMIDLKSFRGEQNVVLYFYPKDNTSGCTKQAEAFQEKLAQFKKLNTVIIGVSPDPIKSHDNFRKKYGLKYLLLADEQKKAANDYGVWVEKSMYGRKYMGIQRATFLIDKTGKIAAVWPKVKVDGHVDDVLATAKNHK